LFDGLDIFIFPGWLKVHRFILSFLLGLNVHIDVQELIKLEASIALVLVVYVLKLLDFKVVL
jgi:hypothetical protein